MEQLFGAARLQKALHYQADTFASVVLHNDGKGGFTMSSLPDRGADRAHQGDRSPTTWTATATST